MSVFQRILTPILTSMEDSIVVAEK